jgi:glycosyltransferase involved in cell wall biosynthesis
MKIILFAHPSFLKHQSMPRYANMLLVGMEKRGHLVEVWTPKARFFNLPVAASLQKWMGYIDQYLVFPLEVKLKLRNCTKDTLFVFADQALGPWVPLVKNRLHVVHCHDFLALKSALGTVPENPTSFSGKLYQNYIRDGFSKGKHFICISKKTKEDLLQLHRGTIESVTVCYNGLNRSFEVIDRLIARRLLAQQLQIELSNGYVMHVGGNQYYKNRVGVVEIYETWRATTKVDIPLLLVGESPSKELQQAYQSSAFKKEIYFIEGLADNFINTAYSGASCLLFPSLDEGFGWPIAEAMALGCTVITTNKAPMSEVGGIAAFYVDKKPIELAQLQEWKEASANVLEEVVTLSVFQENEAIEASLKQSQKFSSEAALDAIEAIYKNISE